MLREPSAETRRHCVSTCLSASAFVWSLGVAPDVLAFCGDCATLLHCAVLGGFSLDERRDALAVALALGLPIKKQAHDEGGTLARRIGLGFQPLGMSHGSPLASCP